MSDKIRKVMNERAAAQQLLKAERQFARKHKGMMTSKKPPSGARARAYLSTSKRLHLLRRAHEKALRDLLDS